MSEKSVNYEILSPTNFLDRSVKSFRTKLQLYMGIKPLPGHSSRNGYFVWPMA